MGVFLINKVKEIGRCFFASNSVQWYSSDWKILLNNSAEYFKMMELAYNNHLYNQVLHNGHLLIELVLKSAISRNLGKHPYGHEISKLSNIMINGNLLLKEINKDANAQKAFNKIRTAWKMQYRYEKRSVGQTEALKYLNAYKEAHKWIETNYCQ